MLQQKIKLMMWRTTSIRNWNVCFTNSLNTILGDFNANVGKEDIFKLTIWNESLHDISNDSGDRLVNFATSKNLRVKSTMVFPSQHP
jgi:hypothetical protein